MSGLSDEFHNALEDIAFAIKRRSVSIVLGWNDVRSRYNRSRIGVFWASLSMLIFVGALGPIYARLIGAEITVYMLHLLLGFVLWNYISSIVMESGREFINSSSYLVSFQLSYFSLLFRVIWRNLVVFFYQMIVFVVFAIVLGHSPSVNWITAPLGLLILTLNALWMGVLMSIFATRFRDLSELMNNIFRLAFFVTPIIWMPQNNSELAVVADLNPFYHLLELVREPLVSAQINLQHWWISLATMVFGWLIAFPFFVKYRSRIAFWL